MLRTYLFNEELTPRADLQLTRECRLLTFSTDYTPLSEHSSALGGLHSVRCELRRLQTSIKLKARELKIESKYSYIQDSNVLIVANLTAN